MTDVEQQEDEEDRAHGDWLVARERGEVVDGPAPEIREQYRRLGEQIGALPPPVSSEAGWEAKVLAAIDRRETTPRRPRRIAWIAAAAGAAAVAIAVLWFVLRRGGEAAQPPTLALEIKRQDAVVRGDEIAVGDTLTATSRLGRGDELRVYQLGGGARVVARCPQDAACRVSGGATSIDVVLAAGSYRAIVLDGTGTAPPPSDRFDDDVAAARAAGFAVITLPPIEAR